MILPITSCNLRYELKNIGVHQASIETFMNKSAILPLKVLKVRTPAANIIKQEMLACGGDCAVHAGCVVCAQDHSDILLLGTKKHYRLLLQKMAMMPYFGLPKIKEELQSFLENAPLKTILADNRVLEYDHVVVMGILNITPDSFYADSRVRSIDEVINRAGQMLRDGAEILDIGGESTRPGSDSINPQEEIARIVPVVEALRKEYPQSILSIDTYHAETAEATLASGADIINDISAMEYDEKMIDVVVKNNAPVILMHMRGTPKNMQQNTEYGNVVEEVSKYLKERAEMLRGHNFPKEKIILDPGIGFAKNVDQNLKLMQGLSEMTGSDYPVLLAASRKSTIGKVLGDIPPEARLAGTIATSCQAVYAGANMVRVHDVKENIQAIRMLEAIIKCQ
ncbi:MAG: dihydropteroate synthase [Acidaminococcaceae bacterium]|nr:dihydropteroate synthase [Acidaminococcaceae bacterium]